MGLRPPTGQPEERKLDVEGLAHQVQRRLRNGLSGTVVAVAPDGSITVESPGAPISSPHERGRHALATFVVTNDPAGYEEVLERIRSGVRKHVLSR
jgi:hypothetical protein